MWVNDIANKIIKNNPNKEEFILNCGTSTTGVSHIGNFREVSIVYFVARALEVLNKKTKIVLSFDDFDRFKKVPTNVDEKYKDYIGMPVCDIKSPFSEREDYAEYFENLFIEEMNLLGIKLNAVRQSDRYKNGVYNKYYPIIFKNREKIKDIINEHKTSKDENMFPFHIYCEKCNKDFTTVTDINDDDNTFIYVCECGYSNKKIIDDCCNVKPVFKVDWPMRWKFEGVDFEASGKSHMTKGGAFDVSSEILTEVFKGNKIIAEKYEFVELEGATNRISKTSGKVYTISDMLKYYPPKMLLWLFLKEKPYHKIKIGFGDSVLVNYLEYEKFLKDNSQNSNDMKAILNITEQDIAFANYEMKDLVADICSLLSNDDIIVKYGENEFLIEKIKYAKQWINENNKVPQLLECVNLAYCKEMEENQKEYIRTLKTLLEGETENVFKEMKKIYAGDGNFNMKQMCCNFYNLIYGVSEGASISKIIKFYGKDKILPLLEV